MNLFQELKNEKRLVNIALILLIIALGSYVISLFWGILSIFSDVIVILLVAWILSFVLEPLIDFVNATFKVSKVFSTLFVYIVLLLLISAGIFLFIPVVVEQIQILLKVVPTYFDNTPPLINRWGDSVMSSLSGSVAFLPSVAQFFFSIFIVILLSFYFNVDRDLIGKEFFEFLPKSWLPHFRSFYKVTDTTLASFLRIQLIFGILSFISTWIVLVIFRVDLAVSISFLSGIFAIIPMIGPFLALIPPIALIVVVDPIKALMVGIVLLAIQQVIFNIIGPKLLGNALKLHPAIILLSFVLGAKIGGPVGAIFAIPIIGILSVYLKALSKHFFRFDQTP